MGRHSGCRRAPRRVPAVAAVAPLLTLSVGAVAVLPVSTGLGVRGSATAYAAPVDPTPSRPATPPGRPKPTPTPTLTETPTDPPTTAAPTDTSTTSQPPSGSTATGTATTGSGGSGGSPSSQPQSIQAQPSQAPPPAASGSTGRATTPATAATGGNGSNAGGNGNGRPPQVGVAGRKVASPAGDGRSTLDVVPAVGTTVVPVQPTGSPDGTSSLPPDDPEPSATATTTTTTSGSPGPDLADPPSADAMPGTWRLAALAALFVLALAVALLIASARPRGGAHRRH